MKRASRGNSDCAQAKKPKMVVSSKKRASCGDSACDTKRFKHANKKRTCIDVYDDNQRKRSKSSDDSPWNVLSFFRFAYVTGYIFGVVPHVREDTVMSDASDWGSSFDSDSDSDPM